MLNQLKLPKSILVTSVLVSGLLLYFTIDLSGRYGFLLWLAPLPLIWISLQSTSKTAFFCALVAGLIGRSNWIPYLSQLMPLVPIIIVTILPAVLLGCSIILNRWIVLKSQSAWSVFAFPAIATVIDFIIFNNPLDGTAGSMAYTQANYLAVIQVASVTGISGIVFLTALLPSAVAMGWYFKEKKSKQVFTIGAASLVLLLVLSFGVIRINQSRSYTIVNVGMTVVPENIYTDGLGISNANQIIGRYISQISAFSEKEVSYILFPEKVIQINSSLKDSVIFALKATSAQMNATIVGGLTIMGDSTRQNLGEFISPSGEIQEYRKRFHVKGFEGDFEPGSEIGILHTTEFAGGLAICKDMDFPQWLRKYQDVELLFVPAWDFALDGWLHSRMAILRGVENGFTIVRAARQGRHTVSDYRGKVLAEGSSETGEAVSLLAQAPVYKIQTIYSKWGDWFGLMCIVITVTFIAYTFNKSRIGKRHHSTNTAGAPGSTS